MSLIHPHAPKQEHTHWVIYNSRYGGFAAPATKADALTAFTRCVALGHFNPSNGRSMRVMSETEYQRTSGGTR